MPPTRAVIAPAQQLMAGDRDGHAIQQLLLEMYERGDRSKNATVIILQRSGPGGTDHAQICIPLTNNVHTTLAMPDFDLGCFSLD